MPEVVPLGLRHAIESGECVLFVGAGIGAHLKGPDGISAPDGESLAKQLAKHFGIETEIYDLAKISQVVALRKGRPELDAFVRKQLGNLRPDETLKWLMSLRWRAIFTTNYDHGIQQAYDLIPNPQQKPITIGATSDLVVFDPRFEVPVYHLHGTLFGVSKPQIVITEDDYTKFRERRRMLFELLKNEFATSTFLYIGYSNRDPNWKLVLSELFAEFLPSTPPSSYRITPSTDPLDIEILRAQNIECISASVEEFVAAAAAALSEIRVDPDRINILKHKIPSSLIPAFGMNPAATARLLSSWTYANQAPFDDMSNTGAFLKGDRPNWGLIGRRQYFERDIEEQLYEDLLDYATSSSKLPKVFIVLGSAGYGVSMSYPWFCGHQVTSH
jgi:SIR2-like domain